MIVNHDTVGIEVTHALMHIPKNCCRNTQEGCGRDNTYTIHDNNMLNIDYCKTLFIHKEFIFEFINSQENGFFSKLLVMYPIFILKILNMCD